MSFPRNDLDEQVKLLNTSSKSLAVDKDGQSELSKKWSWWAS